MSAWDHLYFLFYSPRKRTLLLELFFSFWLVEFFPWSWLAWILFVSSLPSQYPAAEPYWTKRATQERASERSESPFARDFSLTDLTSLIIFYSTPQQQNPSLFFPKVKRIWESASRRGLGKKCQGKAPWGRGWGREWRAPPGLRSGRDKMVWREYNYNLNIFSSIYI